MFSNKVAQNASNTDIVHYGILGIGMSHSAIMGVGREV